MDEISVITAKISFITPTEFNRTKRRLVNFVGSAYKWLFGLMDDTDRQEIVERLEVMEENCHTAISTINKQISINRDFQNNMNLIKKLLMTIGETFWSSLITFKRKTQKY